MFMYIEVLAEEDEDGEEVWSGGGNPWGYAWGGWGGSWRREETGGGCVVVVVVWL